MCGQRGTRIDVIDESRTAVSLLSTACPSLRAPAVLAYDGCAVARHEECRRLWQCSALLGGDHQRWLCRGRRTRGVLGHDAPVLEHGVLLVSGDPLVKQKASYPNSVRIRSLVSYAFLRHRYHRRSGLIFPCCGLD